MKEVFFTIKLPHSKTVICLFIFCLLTLLPSADEVEEVMSLLRNSAEEFAAADKPSDKVMRTLHSFLEIPHIRSLLSEQAKKIDEIRDTGIKEPETLTSQSDTPQQQKSEITESKDDTSNQTSSIGVEGESLNTEANDKFILDTAVCIIIIKVTLC